MDIRMNNEGRYKEDRQNVNKTKEVFVISMGRAQRNIGNQLLRG